MITNPLHSAASGVLSAARSAREVGLTELSTRLQVLHTRLWRSACDAEEQAQEGLDLEDALCCELDSLLYPALAPRYPMGGQDWLAVAGIVVAAFFAGGIFLP